MKSVLLTLLATFGLYSYSQTTTSNAQRPNIVVFIVDDMGWEDTSLPFWKERVPNNDIYHTPNMERLAARGIQFTQGYAASVCSPSRVSLLTGSNAARHRITEIGRAHV